MAKTKEQLKEIREMCEADLFTFAQWVNPNRLYGDIHKELCKWLTKPDAKPNQLVLLPRGHMKSHIIAVWAAWWITIHPETTILYLSATATLAEAQLYAIKNILTSKPYRMLWPEMVNEDEGKREKWTSNAIAVDHPKRKEEGVRDMTVIAGGLTTNTTGLHADVIIADDIVVPDNAYTEEGRRKVAAAMSQMASIKNTGGIMKAVGTRYHPRDQYYIWKEQKMKVFDEEGNVIGEEPVWEIFERQVEENGVFLWPRTQRPSDGKWFGFDFKELARIEAEYTDRTQFFAQYYNNPNDESTQRISRDCFKYYNVKDLEYIDGRWHYKGKPLNIYAAIDFAYTLNKRSDYTAIVVVGIDYDGYIYVLDIDRFKTNSIVEYFNHIVELHSKWQFHKLRAEVTAAQSIIVKDLKDHVIREGLRLTIDEFRPTGKKEERIAAVLEHRYQNESVFHTRGGLTHVLEDELVMANPPHDDLKDALASAVEIAIKPLRRGVIGNRNKLLNVNYNSKFGGIV